MEQPKISVIIPVLNEADNLNTLLPYLKQHTHCSIEIIVVDAGSDDESSQVAFKNNATVISSQKGRAVQMNKGAKEAQSNLLYFLHADCLPPKTFSKDIIAHLETGYDLGCYRYNFDSPSKLLKFNAYMTRFGGIMCRGGDQSLFVTKQVFNQLNGYKEDYIVMEDYDFIQRAKKKYKFVIMDGAALVSARKYDSNSYLRVNLANLTVFLLYFMRVHPVKLHALYKKMINHPKAI